MFFDERLQSAASKYLSLWEMKGYFFLRVDVELSLLGKRLKGA
jgi:hypothetical protein